MTAGYKAAEEYVRGAVRRWGRGRTLLVGVIGALMLLAVSVISAAALVGLPTIPTTNSSVPTTNSAINNGAGASQGSLNANNVAAAAPEGATLSAAATLDTITYVCVNKSSGQLFYLASCKKSQTKVSVTSSSPQFKACYLASNGLTRKVSSSTACSSSPRKKENTIPKVPADSSSLYFCVGTDGTMYFKGTSQPTCPAGQKLVVIGPHNRPPSAAGDGPYGVAEDASLDVVATEGVLANDTDPDGDPITAQLDAGPSHADSFTLNADGSFSYRPEANYNGPDSFTYKAKDSHNGLSAAATVTIDVTPVNDTPEAVDDGSATSPAATTEEDVPTGQIDVLSNDSGLGDTPISVTIETQGAKGTADVNPDNTITYTPNADANGSDSFVYKVCDADSTPECDTATVHVEITSLNDTPSAADDGSAESPAATVGEDSTTSATINVLSNDTGLGDTPITVSINSQGAKGTATANSDNTVTYVPGADQNGPDSFVYEVCDADGDCDTATVTITIDPVNDAPSFDLGADQTVVNTDGPQTVSGFATNISAGPQDEESTQTLTFDVTNSDNSLFSEQPDIDESSGDLTYTPAENASGTAEVSVTLTDDGGTASGGEDTSTTKTFQITVKLPNSPPTASSQSVIAEEDTPMTITLEAEDPDGDAVTEFAITAQPAHGTLGPIGSINCDGQPTNHCTADVSYTPNADYNGPDQFEFTASDGQETSDPATVEITVNAVDDPPVAEDDSATVDEDSDANTIDVLANDTDVDGGTNTIDSVTQQPANGTVAITNNGNDLTYKPNADYCNDNAATDDFTYKLNGGSEAKVSVTVTCVEDNPVAVNDDKTVAEDDPATTIDVLANDTDVDSGPKTIQSVTQPAHGTVAITNSGSDLTYVPKANYCNDQPGTDPDTFTYTLSPGGSTATVSVKVTCVDDPPVAVNDSATVLEDAAATSVSVLTNDTDIDDGPKTIDSVTQPANGTVVITGSGSGLTYVPKANYCNDPPGSSPDTFTYKLNGGSQGTVSMTVTCVNDAPVAVADSFTSTASSALANTTMTVGTTVSEPHTSSSGNPLSNDTDVDSPASGFTVTPVTNATTTRGGKVTINSDGTFTYRPPPGITTNGGSSPDDTFTYTLHDNGNPDQTATGTVTVRIVGPTPWYVDDTAAAGGNGTSGAPFQSLGPLSSSGGSDSLDGDGDRIFVYSGTYTSGIALENNQKLLGEPQGLSFTDNNGRSQSLVPAGGSAPAISSSSGPVVGLASGNELQDLSLGNVGSNATSLSGTNVGTATVADSSINTNGKAIDINTGTLAMTLGSVSSAGSGSEGIKLTNVGGSLTINGGSLTNATNAEVAISQGSPNFNYAGSITDDQGTLVSIANTTGGTKSFTGAITDGNDGDGSGVSLTGNSGGTTSFSGGLVLSTGANPAFTATGGGTVNVTGTANTLATTTGTALNVANTTIGGSGLNFRSISANGATNGIVLNNTGSSGGLTATGNGGTCTSAATCTGGAIQNATATGISLTSVPGGVSLTRMFVNDSLDDGIGGANVTGLTLDNATVTSNGNANGDNGIDFTQLTGTSPLTNSNVSSNFDSNVFVSNASGVLNLNVTGGAYSGASGGQGDGIFVEGTGTGSQNLNVQGPITFANNVGDHVQHSADADNTTDSDVTINNATMTSPPAAGGGPTCANNILGGGIVISHGGNVVGGSNLDATVTNNNIQNSCIGAIAIGTSGSVVNQQIANVDATIQNNIIGTAGVEGSGSVQGNGIFVDSNGNSVVRTLITGNAIRQWTNRNGIALDVIDGDAEMSATVRNNILTEPNSAFPGTTTRGMTIQLGSAQAGDSIDACLDIGHPTDAALKNQVAGTGEGVQPDIRYLHEGPGSVVQLAGYSGPTTPAIGNIVSYLQPRNNLVATPTVSGIATAPGGSTTTSVASCPLPAG